MGFSPNYRNAMYMFILLGSFIVKFEFEKFMGKAQALAKISINKTKRSIVTFKKEIPHSTFLIIPPSRIQKSDGLQYFFWCRDCLTLGKSQ